MKALEKFIDRFLGPVASYMGNSAFFSSLTEAFMKTTPITLGVALIMIVGNFPATGWIDWLKSIGIYYDFIAAQGATMNVLSLFVTFNVAYAYTKNKSAYNPQIAGLVAISCFLILMPQRYMLYTFTGPIDYSQFGVLAPNLFDATINSITELNGFSQQFLGGEGLLVAILVGFTSSLLYMFLNKKNIVVKMPASVPANVSESLKPSILVMIMFAVFFGIRLIFSIPAVNVHFTSFFDLITKLLQMPLQGLVSEPAFLIVILTITNVFWYFGVHPQIVYTLLTPMVLANTLQNIGAYQQGVQLPYLAFSVIGTAMSAGFGGQGGTLGLVLSMATAKSKRYKEMFKLSFVPALFNINEPLIFGMPIMLNPIFFIPMVLSPLLMGGVGYVGYALLKFNLNPTVSLPWTTNAVIKAFLQGGWKYAAIMIAVLVVTVIVWYPFFKVADNRECAAEKALGVSETA